MMMFIIANKPGDELGTLIRLIPLYVKAHCSLTELKNAAQHERK